MRLGWLSESQCLSPRKLPSDNTFENILAINQRTRLFCIVTTRFKGWTNSRIFPRNVTFLAVTAFTVEAYNSSLEEANASRKPCENKGPLIVPLTVEWAVFSVEFVASLLGNVLIISVSCTNQRLKNTLRSYFTQNLAATNISISFFGPGYMLVFSAAGHTVPPNMLGTLICKVIHPLIGVSLYSAVLTLVVIAVDRFLAIRLPRRKITRPNTARVLVLLTWLASLVTCSPLIYAMRVDERGYCTEKWTPLFSVNSPRVFSITVNILFYAIPLVVIAVLYGAIITKVWARKIPGEVTDANQIRETKTKTQVLKMLTTVVLVFAVCWFPIHLNMVLVDFGLVTCLPYYVWSTGVFLAYSNAAINPLIYLLFSTDYRQGAISIARKVFCSCWQPCLACQASVSSYNINSPAQSPQQARVEIELNANLAAVTATNRETQDK